MKPNDIERILNRQPRQPFRLVLADGEEITVPLPQKAHLSGAYLACAGIGSSNGGAGAERLRIVAIKDIDRAQVLPK